MLHRNYSRDVSPFIVPGVVLCKSNITTSFAPGLSHTPGQYNRNCGPTFQKRPKLCPFT